MPSAATTGGSVFHRASTPSNLRGVSVTAGNVTSRQSKLVAVGLYIAVYAATGSAVPYIAVYFEQLGLTLDAIGIYFALSAICGLIASPIWGVVADQYLGSRWSLFAAT